MHVQIPEGWIEQSRTPDRSGYVSPDGRQAATVSITEFRDDLSFDQFRIVCEHRVAAEKRAALTAFVESTGPATANSRWEFFYSGAERASARLFSGYMAYASRKVFTLYLESFGASPKEHLSRFADLVRSVVL